MRLSNVLFASPPKFKFWHDFGAGKQRRYPFHKYWKIQWRNRVAKIEIKDHRLTPNQLPTGSKIVEAKSLIYEPIEGEKTYFYNHPWPYEDKVSEFRDRMAYSYTMNTRFYVPQVDCSNLTNTLITTNQEFLLKASRQSDQQLSFDRGLDSDILEIAQRRYEWATKDDFALIALPRKRDFPRIDQRPKRKYGSPHQRITHNVLSTLNDFTLGILAQKYAYENNLEALSKINGITTIPYLQVNVPQERDGRLINFNCELDYANLSNFALPAQDTVTQEKDNEETKTLPSMGPRLWRSLLEQKNNYNNDWRFTLPKNRFVHSILISPRIIRELKDYEMLDRIAVYSFATALQMARLNYSRCTDNRNEREEQLRSPVNQLEVLPEPVTLQSIGFDAVNSTFHFGRFQLNSACPSSPVKNRLWYSGPINDFETALAHWLAIQSYGESRNQIHTSKGPDNLTSASC